MTVQPTQPPDQPRTADRNRTALDAFLAYAGLPDHGPIEARPDAVYVHVTDASHLDLWWAALRDHGVHAASIECDRTLHGLRLWTLHATTPPGKGDYTAPIVVHATAPDVLPGELDRLAVA